jgi:hypothetical protein
VSTALSRFLQAALAHVTVLIPALTARAGDVWPGFQVRRIRARLNDLTDSSEKPLPASR